MIRHVPLPPVWRFVVLLLLSGAVPAALGSCSTVPVNVSVLLDADGKQRNQAVPSGKESNVTIEVQGGAEDRLELRYRFFDEVTEPYLISEPAIVVTGDEPKDEFREPQVRVSTDDDRRTVKFTLPETGKRFLVYNLLEKKCYPLSDKTKQTLKQQLDKKKADKADEVKAREQALKADKQSDKEPKKGEEPKKDKDPKASSEAADPTAETILTWNGKVVL